MAGSPFRPLIHLFFIALSFSTLQANTEEHPFDVRRHLATVTSYSSAKGANNDAYTENVPDSCEVVHLNLIARHGTRAPTKKRIKEMDLLAIRLRSLLNNAEVRLKDDISSQKIPEWFYKWQSPWKGRKTGGELIEKGEEELYHLGTRVRERFPDLFSEDYHPEIYTIRATQVSRASASAVAFGMGLFSGKGKLGPGQHRAFSVISESRASDICLRFFDTCETYKEFRKNQEPAVVKLKEPVLDEITSQFIKRYQLSFTRQDVASLWFLCKQEASLLNITCQACSLFSPTEVSLLEWTDDLEGFILKGYGQAVNYRMGIPLLQDVFQSIEQAIKAKEENHNRGTFEKARLRFAHAETIVPFSCLLGLFLDGSEFEQIQREEPLQQLPKPPLKRNWRGSTVAPFAGNNMLVLYSCPSSEIKNSVKAGDSVNKYFIQVLHNEAPVKLHGCDNRSFCPFEVFKERIVIPHLKHDFKSVCNQKLDPLPSKRPCSIGCKLLNFFGWLLFPENTKSRSELNDEL